MIEFMNLFIVPLISLGIHVKRNVGFDHRYVDVLFGYASYTVTETLLLFVIMKVLASTIGFGVEPSSVVYTFFGLIISIAMPYIYELYKKYIDIRCKIERK